MMIRQGDPKVIQNYLTIWSVFRNIEFPATAKISTITSPFSGDRSIFSRLQEFIPYFTTAFVPLYLRKDPLMLMARSFSVFPISKASPTSSWRNWFYEQIPEEHRSSTHPWALFLSLVSLNANLEMHFHLKRYLETLRNKLSLFPYVWLGFDPLGKNPAATDEFYVRDFINPEPESKTRAWINRVLDLLNEAGTYPLELSESRYSKIPLGKIGQKEEAAGKMRIFAMVDPVTQWAMRPLHRLLFKILKTHQMDGTFDQLKPLNRVPYGKPLYSLDLSAATDRLPLLLQQLLLNDLIKNEDFVESWGQLLVGRSYRYKDFDAGSIIDLKYAVGQPMGALSSWAMLAYTHHFIVQAAAWRAGVIRVGRLFKDYAILGDDICIFNKHVALQYLKIVRALGVECNLSKSIISPSGTGIEFAKKTFYKGVNVSPTPFAEFAEALQSLTALMEYSRKYKLSFSSTVAVAGFGYKVLGGLNKPINKLNARVRVLKFSFNLPLTEDLLPSYLHKITKWLKLPQVPVIFNHWIKEEYSKLQESILRSAHQFRNMRAPAASPEALSNWCRGDKRLLGFLNHLYETVYTGYRLNGWRSLAVISESMSQRIMYTPTSGPGLIFTTWKDFLECMQNSSLYSLSTLKIERPDINIDRKSTQAWRLLKRFSDTASQPISYLPPPDSNVWTDVEMMDELEEMPIRMPSPTVPQYQIYIRHGVPVYEKVMGPLPLTLAVSFFKKWAGLRLVRRAYSWLRFHPYRYDNWMNLGRFGPFLRFILALPLYIIEWFTLLSIFLMVIMCVLILVWGAEWFMSSWLWLCSTLPLSQITLISSIAASIGLALPIPLPWYRRWYGNICWFMSKIWTGTSWSFGSCLSILSWSVSFLIGLTPIWLKAWFVTGIGMLVRDTYFGNLHNTFDTISRHSDYWATHPKWAALMSVSIHLVLMPVWELSHLISTYTVANLSWYTNALFNWLLNDAIGSLGDLGIFLLRLVSDVGGETFAVLLDAILQIGWIAQVAQWTLDHPVAIFLTALRVISRVTGITPITLWLWLWGGVGPYLTSIFRYFAGYIGLVIPESWITNLYDSHIRHPRFTEGPPGILDPNGGLGIIRQSIMDYIRARTDGGVLGEVEPDPTNGSRPVSPAPSSGSDDSDITINGSHASGSVPRVQNPFTRDNGFTVPDFTPLDGPPDDVSDPREPRVGTSWTPPNSPIVP
jgi:hypothetical protein